MDDPKKDYVDLKGLNKSLQKLWDNTAKEAKNIDKEDLLVAESEEDSWKKDEPAGNLNPEYMASFVTQAKLQRFENKTDLIKEYANKLFWFLVSWSFVVFAMADSTPKCN